MDEELSQPHSVSLLNQNGKRRPDNGGDDDRLSQLPNEILFLILSFLPVRRAASTTVLSSRWLDLWKQIPDLRFNLESDRISQLPDRIISDILSFLPLKQAVATSVLSSRWLDSWKHTHNLSFHLDTFGDSIEDACKYEDIMNSILQSHKARFLKLFRIRSYGNKSGKREVTKWLEFVFLRQVESFELSLFRFEGEDKVVLKELLRELKMLYGDPRTLIFFQSLKSLHLASLEVCSPSLKRLEICNCSGGISVEVTAPNLTFIWFSEGPGKLLFENVPSLVEAAFDIDSSEFVKHHFASEASHHISQLQYLRILFQHSKMFLTNEAFPQMLNLKKLVISCFETYNHSLLPVTRLIWASPRLEEFTLKLQFFGTCEAPTAYMAEMTNVAVVGRDVPDLVHEQLQSQLPDHVQLSIRPPWY